MRNHGCACNSLACIKHKSYRVSVQGCNSQTCTALWLCDALPAQAFMINIGDCAGE